MFHIPTIFFIHKIRQAFHQTENNHHERAAKKYKNYINWTFLIKFNGRLKNIYKENRNKIFRKMNDIKIIKYYLPFSTHETPSKKTIT